MASTPKAFFSFAFSMALFGGGGDKQDEPLVKQVEALRQDVGALAARMDRIEKKLDQVLEIFARAMGSQREGLQGAIISAKKAQCASNLKQIGILMELYRTKFGAPNYDLPHETGREFLKLLQTKVAESQDMSLFVCPLSSRKDRITYRGPKRDLNDDKNVKATDVMICDDPDNHPDGTIHCLLRSYDVNTLTKDDPGYQKALQDTRE